MTVRYTNLYVSDLLTGARTTVRIATTIAGTLATSFAAGQTIDGITLVLSDRILIKDQASAIENGVYIVTASTPIRAIEMQPTSAANSIFIWVKEGTTNATTAWICNSAPGSDIVGTNNIVFIRYDATGTLSVARGGTGRNTLTSNSVLIGNGTGSVDISKAAPTGVFVGTTDSQTLTNKTLTSPIINQINDANGNEELVFVTTASAVNEFTMQNAATGNAPTLLVTGTDANINMSLSAKGTGSINLLGTTADSAELRFFENTTNGTNSIGITAPASLAADYTLTLPTTLGTTGQTLTLANNSGTLTFSNSATTTPPIIPLFTGFALADSLTSFGVATFVWDSAVIVNANYSSLKLIFYAASVIDPLVVKIDGLTSGNLVTKNVAGGSADGIQTATVTMPVVSDVLTLSMNRTTITSPSPPLVYGVVLELIPV